MRILFVGDTHGGQDLGKIGPDVVERLALTSEDIIIQSGDMAVPWIESYDENLAYWASLPCQVIVCLGNHENYGWIKEQELVTRYGGQGYLLAENIFAPKIGEILEIEDRSFWFYPGAYSIDYVFRKLGRTLFKEELPLKEESQRVKKALRKRGHVDVIVSHDGPSKLIREVLGFPIGDVSDSYLEMTGQERGERVHPGLALNEIMEEEELYGHWYFGHHHRDFTKGKLTCLMKEMVLWDLETDKKEVIR